MNQQKRTPADQANTEAANKLARAQQAVAKAFDLALEEVKQYDSSILQATTGQEAAAVAMLKGAEAASQWARVLTDAQARVDDAQRKTAESAALLLKSQEEVAAAAERKATERTALLIKGQKETAAAFERSKVALLGWATAGLTGTTMGDRLNWQFTLLRREITQLFLPAIEHVSRWIEQLTGRFRSLTGEQQNNIGRWLLAGAAALGFVATLGKLEGAFGALLTRIRLIAVANPFLAVAAGLGLLLAQTEGGRNSLREVGTALASAFESAVEVLSGALVPILEFLASVLDGLAGKIALWGVVGYLAITRLVGGVRVLIATFGGLGVAIAAATLALSLLLAMKFRTNEVDRETQAIAAQVRSGRLSQEKAEEQIREKAQREGFEAEERARREIQGPFGRLLLGGQDKEYGEEVRRESEATGLATVRRAAEGGKDRNQLLLSQTGQEDPRATIHRIQSAVLKVDTGERTAKNTEDTAKNTEESARNIQEILTQVRGFLNWFSPDRDTRDRPPKDD